MAARFTVLLVGKAHTGWPQQAVDDYSRRMQRLGGVEEIAVKAERFVGDIEAVRRVEGLRLRERMRGSLVCLDERGEDLDTDGFTQLVDRGRQLGPVTFAIGGAYGHAAETRAVAWRSVRLSSLVLNHELARVVLYEQLYRAMTRLEGIPYHH